MSDATSQARSDRVDAESELEARGWRRAHPFTNGSAWWLDPLGPGSEPVMLREAVTRAEGRDAAVREVMEG